MARCYDCLSEDVTVKVIDEYGFEHWFCATDWAAEQKFSDAIMTMLDDAYKRLAQEAETGMTGDLSAFKPLGAGPLLGK